MPTTGQKLEQISLFLSACGYLIYDHKAEAAPLTNLLPMGKLVEKKQLFEVLLFRLEKYRKQVQIPSIEFYFSPSQSLKSQEPHSII